MPQAPRKSSAPRAAVPQLRPPNGSNNRKSASRCHNSSARPIRLLSISHQTYYRGESIRWCERGEAGVNGRLVVVFALLLATAGPTALGSIEVDSDSLGATGLGLATASSGDAGGSPGAEVAQREPPDENNTTVAHRNPAEVSDEESLDDVQIWLDREMTGRLAESVNMSQEDRERARELIGNNSEYAELAEQYQEVRDQPGDVGPEDDPLRAGQLQRKFFAEVELYRQIHEEYRRARSNNETLRTRQLAHELERRAVDINRTAMRLNETYANISSVDEAQLRNATRTIGEIRSNVTRTQMTVRNQTLVRTQLSVRAEDPNGSFTDPVTLVGRLQTADGEPVADENVTLLVGNRTLNATTDERGRFETEYRPTLAGVGEWPRTVEFRPANESVYLRDNATAEFEVRQVEPDVTVSNRSATIRYNETLVVNGTVAADGVGVPDVPLAVTVDGVQIAQVRTDEDGSFGAAGRFPANVSTGDQKVNVSLALENATSRADGPVAIVPSTESAQVRVEEMGTSLSIADVQTFNQTAFVAGRLTTEDGEPLANRTVELRVGGRTVGNATTNGTGDYATTVTIPQRLLGGDSTVEVVVAYSPSDGNLAPARANATAAVDSSGMAISDDQLRLGVAGLLGIAVFSAFVWRFRSDETEPSDRDVDGTDEHPTDFAEARGRLAGLLLNSAQTALSDGESDAAVVAAYAAVRRRLEDDDDLWAEAVEPNTPRTHWEFYDACRDAGLSDERLRRLERLTGTYERAAFAPESASEADARDAVELAESVLFEDEGAKGERPQSEYSERETPQDLDRTSGASDSIS